MAKLKRRSDGRYQLSFTYEGKRYYVYGATKDELEENKSKKKEELKNGLLDHNNPLLDSYYNAFTQFRRNKVREGTIRNQKKWFQRCADVTLSGKITLGNMRIRDIKPTDIKAVQLALIEDGLSTSTVNDYMAHLSHVFNAAVKDETIDRNPCRCIEEISRKEPKARDTKHRALTKEETKDFFSAAKDSYFYNDFRMMIQTGMRIGELGALTYSDISTKDNCIRITKTVTRDEIGAYIIGTMPKTEAGNREIPLNTAIKEIVKDQTKLNKKIFGLTLEDRLFRSIEGDILREYSINREIKRICKAAGIEYFTNHAFRSTFATRFIEQQPQDYKILSEILGHASTKITLDLYTHVMKDSKQKSMQNLAISV